MIIILSVGYLMISVVTQEFLTACYIREYGQNGRIELQRFKHRLWLACFCAVWPITWILLILGAIHVAFRKD